MKFSRNLTLVIVLVLIIGSILYLESVKPKASSTNADIIVSSDNTTATTTMTTTGTTTSVIALPGRNSIIARKATQYPRAKELVDPTGFVNTSQFKIVNLVGKKVVLIDFWTYSCINCQRTIPYLKAWYKKYKDFGLEIVGVHTPEFDFEKDYNNVSKAVATAGITYPVVLDSNMGTWNAYQNLYWPREYLIDIDGFIVHDHIGEGSYAETEQAIQRALQERSTALGLNLVVPTTIVNPNDIIDLDQTKVDSPETYFGAERNTYLANGKSQTTGMQTLVIPHSTDQNELYLGGNWNFTNEYAETTGQTGTVSYTYNAKNVYFVASAQTPTTVKVFVDNVLVNTVTVKDHTLYQLVSGHDYGSHTMRLEIEGPGLDAFTFTFG